MNETAIMERQEIESEVNPVVSAAQALQVIDVVTFGQAMELGKACSARIKMVEEKLGPAKKKTYEAYTEVLRLMQSFTDPLQDAKKLLSGRVYTWQKAEEDRKRKEAEEARRKAEEEAAAKRKAEEDARLELAERLEKEGMKEQAAEVLEAPIVVEVAPVAAPAPKVKIEGASTRENWKWECTDFAALVRAVASGNLSLSLLATNDATITATVKAMKGETKIAGVRVFDAGTVVYRS